MGSINHQFDLEPLTKFAHEVFVAVRFGSADTVIQVSGGNLESAAIGETVKRVEDGNRIGPAGDGHQQPQASASREAAQYSRNRPLNQRNCMALGRR
jgi:hypothetical protein